MTGHVDVDSVCRMSSKVTSYDGLDQAYVGALYVSPGPYKQELTPAKLRLAEVVEVVEHGDIDESLCNDTEKQLGLVPGQDALDDCYWDFNWEHRTLVKVPNLEADPKDGVERADYLMYVCLEEKTGFPRNTDLEELVSGAPKVYGGAFVFKKTTESGEVEGEDPIAAYIQTSDYVFNQGIEESEFKDRILKKLMEAVVHASSAKKGLGSPPH